MHFSVIDIYLHALIAHLQTSICHQYSRSTPKNIPGVSAGKAGVGHIKNKSVNFSPDCRIFNVDGDFVKIRNTLRQHKFPKILISGNTYLPKQFFKSNKGNLHEILIRRYILEMKSTRFFGNGALHYRSGIFGI